MKITSFQPMIITSNENFESVKAVFELMGFEKNHHKDGEDFHDISLKNADGFKVDVVGADIPKDEQTIRMNVRDLNEALEFFESKGFTRRGEIHDTGTSKACMVISPSGFSISVAEHLR